MERFFCGAAVTTLILFIGVLARSASATDYYISPFGNDSRSGTTRLQAWQTLARIEKVKFQAGDRIRLQGGATFKGPLQLLPGDGLEKGVVTIESFGLGRATIQVPVGSGIQIYNRAALRLRGLNIVGPGMDDKTSPADGISFYTDLAGDLKLDHLSLEHVDVSGFTGSGISLGGSGRSGFRHVRIAYTRAHHNAINGIQLWGAMTPNVPGYNHEDVLIEHSQADHNLGNHDTHTISGSGIILAQVKRARVEYCVAHHNGERNGNPNSGPVGIWAWDADQIRIHHNEAFLNHTGTGVDGGGFDLDGGVTNSVMEYNYSHDNDGGGFILCQFAYGRPLQNVVVRGNYTRNDGRKNNYGGILLWTEYPGEISGVEIVNNTIEMSPAASGEPAGITLLSTVGGVKISRNVFRTTGGLPLVRDYGDQPNVHFLGNKFSSGKSPFIIEWQNVRYYSLKEWGTATGQEHQP